MKRGLQAFCKNRLKKMVNKRLAPVLNFVDLLSYQQSLGSFLVLKIRCFVDSFLDPCWGSYT